MMRTGSRLMITGAGGFIGRRCLPLLESSGYDIHAITGQHAYPTGTNTTWHRCDLLDPAACKDLIASIAPSHLLHLAWVATPGRFWNSEINLQWLASGIILLEEFFRRGGRRAVGAGTCAEYQWASSDLDEDSSALKPDTVYGRCKLAMNLALEASAAVHGGSAAWARLFFPYGPGEPAGRLIPDVIRSLLRNETVECTHGAQSRDFVFVDDVARALTSLVDSQAQGAFNVGSGTATTLREMVAVITAKLGHSELVRYGARRPRAGDPERVVADIGKLRRETGWKPTTGIAAGIESTIESWRERLDKGEA